VGARSFGVPSLTKVEAIFRNPALYDLAELIPRPDPQAGGRPRTYPDFMLLGFEALISVYGSARQAEAELGHPLVWELVRRIVTERFPNQPRMHLPPEPMKRYHYVYGRNRYLTAPQVQSKLLELHRRLATEQARELGLLDPQGPGSWTHPDLSRLLYADGKVLTPLFRAKPETSTADQETGEIRLLKHDPDAGLHFEGDGEAAWGTKFVLVAARTEDERGRIILDVEWVPKPGGEAGVAMECFTRLAPLVQGAQGIVYDTALRGVHHQKILREFGLLSINRFTAAEAGAKKPRRKGGRRVEKSIHVEDKMVRRPDGSSTYVRLFARGGALGIGELTDSGDLTLVPLKRVRTHRNRDKSGLYRWYNDYRLPVAYGGGTVTVRLHSNDEDAARGFNRTENVRPIPLPTMTSRPSTPVATTRSRSIEVSWTACTWGEPTPWATPGST